MATAKSFNLVNQDDFMPTSAVMVSEVEADICPWIFKIYQDEACGEEELSALELFFDAYFNPIDYDIDDEITENGFGEQDLERRTVRRFASFNLIADQLRTEYLHQLSCLHNVLLEVQGGDIYQISLITIDRVGTLDQMIENEVRFYFKRIDGEFPTMIGLLACCRPAYTDAPFDDDCPELPGSTAECGAFAVEVSQSGGDLTATPSDAPGPVTTNWLYRETESDPWTILVEDASSVSLGAFGIYKAVTNSEGCSVDDTYLYQDLCESVTVAISEDGAGLLATAGGCESPVFTWYEWDTENTEWDEVFTGTAYVPTGAGVFRVVMSGCGDCVAEAIHDFEGTSTCESFDVGLQYLSGVLNVLHDACEGLEPATYTWYRDTGAGPVLVQSGTDASYDVTTEGLYEVYVICEGGCSGSARKVILESETCVLTLSVGVTGDDATATLDGCGEEPATYTWYRNIGSGFNEVGTGNPFELPGTGLYRLIVACGDCTKQIDFFHCPDTESDTCKQSQYFEGFSGTDLVITEFTLPDTGLYTAQWFRDHLWVFRAAQKVSYDIGFTVDNGTNTITLLWAAEDEYIEVYLFAECV